MDLERHDFQLDELVERIKANDNRLVALQVPEGLKMQALEMMDTIEDESGAKVILAADPCYGACDLVHDKMRSMGVELVAHMGHSQMNIDSGMPTHFIPVTYDGDPELAQVVRAFHDRLVAPWVHRITEITGAVETNVLAAVAMMAGASRGAIGLGIDGLVSREEAVEALITGLNALIGAFTTTGKPIEEGWANWVKG